ncbi:hypothetical protein [Erwinia sp. CGal63]|uniref:hypothetical protein n=1 Tax=Erwinia sp. CGal63 TaxID=2919889 RepID=UPI00300B6C3F
MTILEVKKVLYLNNHQDEYLRYEILANEAGQAILVLVQMSLQNQIGQLSWAVWTKVDELPLPAEETAKATPEEALRMAIDACIKHRAEWQAQA